MTSAHYELVKNEQSARLDLLFTGSFDFVKKSRKEKGSGPWVHSTNVEPQIQI